MPDYCFVPKVWGNIILLTQTLHDESKSTSKSKTPLKVLISKFQQPHNCNPPIAHAFPKP